MSVLGWKVGQACSPLWGGSLQDCYMCLDPSLFLFPGSCHLVGWSTEHRPLALRFPRRVLLIAPPYGWGQVLPVPKSSPISPSSFFWPWKQEILVYRFVFIFLWLVLSRFRLLKLKSLFFCFHGVTMPDPLNREWSWENKTYWWWEKRIAVNLSYYPGSFVLCRH